MTDVAEFISKKKMLRAEMRRRRGDLSSDTVAAASQAVCERLAALAEVQRAASVAGYVAKGGEIDPAAALVAARVRGRDVLLPRVTYQKPRLRFHTLGDGEALVLGPFGLLEPAAAAPERDAFAVDCFIVPGLAFDRSGARLGQGGGYYDELMDFVRARRTATPPAFFVGLAYDFQLVERAPHDAGDARLDAIVTESEVLRP